jgi:hypothetical protein
MYKAPTGPVGTLHQALRSDLRNIPTPDPTPDTAKKMAEVLRAIAHSMRAAESPRKGETRSSEADVGADADGVYWRRCS